MSSCLTHHRAMLSCERVCVQVWLLSRNVKCLGRPQETAPVPLDRLAPQLAAPLALPAPQRRAGQPPAPALQRAARRVVHLK